MIYVLTLLFACGEAHDHPHPHDDHAHEAHEAPAPKEQGATQKNFEGKLGDFTAKLEPSAQSLRLIVVDGSGKPIQATGEARVVLTGAGEAEQRLVLTADDDGWTGAGKATGAAGYQAVVTLEVSGVQQVATIGWGQAPDPKPTEAHGHDHGNDDGHGHAH
jgi:hypothetical protein